MQTIYLDISNKGVVPTVYAKQNDVGRKFAVILTDSGLPYIPEIGSVFSVWYKGASGEGNYTDIGNKSAFSLNGNKVEVEMIVQMLSAHGDGILCLTLNSPDGNQISSWNIPYMCEMVPGSESEKAEEYYTAFSKAVEELPYPDETLSISGKAADSAAVGKSLAKKADISYTKKICNPHNLLDNSDFRNPVNQRGYESGAGVSDYAYFLDRWKHGIAEKTNYTLSSAGLGIPSGTYIVQVNETIRSGTYTFAVKQSDGSITILNCVVSFAADGSWKRCGTISADCMALHVDTENGHVVYIIQSYKDVVVEWAAFYEGSYTADTLPPYVPKGYGAELLECQRYFVHIGSDSAYCIVGTGTAYNSSTCGVLVPLPVEMRTVPVVPITGQLILRNKAGNEVACSEVALDIIGVATAYLKCIASGLTLGASYDAFLSPGNYLSFSANL